MSNPVAMSTKYGAPPAQTMAPPGGQAMSTEPPADAGLGWLATIDGLYVAQRMEIFEALTGCDTKNRYHITPIPQGALPPTGPIPTEWLKHFRTQADAMPLLKAKEESECVERICCPLFRKFDMGFKDGAGQQFFSIHRPFRFSIGCPCCMVNPQELTLFDATGQPAAKSVEEFRFLWCCTRQFTAETFDFGQADPTLQYHLRAPECGSSQGSNLCAPSCLNESYDMDVYDASESAVVGLTANVWPGCNCMGLTDRSNLVVRFPPGSTPKQRAALIASLFLVEFAHFEAKRQDNNGGGGGGGA